jgi:hypothetical protein
MRYLFIDESGDTGLDFSKSKTSKHFVVTLIETENKNAVDRVVANVFRKVRQKKKGKDNSLHSYKESHSTKVKLLSELARLDIRITYNIIYKPKQVLTRNQHDLYLSVMLWVIAMAEQIESFENQEKPELNIYISQRETSRSLNQRLIDVVNSLSSKSKITIFLKTPAQEKGLQAVDFISWAVFKKFEHGISDYYDIIRAKIFNAMIPEKEGGDL